MVYIVIFATTCYFTYKSTISDYVTAGLSLNSMTIAVTAYFCINALASYPVQILCVFEIFEEAPFFNKIKDSNQIKTLKMIAMRTIVVVLLTFLTSVIPNFIEFLNITGALGSAVLGFILPCILYIQFHGVNGLPRYVLAFNIFLILFGTFGGVFSIYNSIKKLSQ